MKKIFSLVVIIMLMLSSLLVLATEYTDKETIQKVQQALNDVGYNCGTPDGIAGKKTCAAITDYQTAKGLTITGSITEELLNSLGLGEDTSAVGYRFLDIPWGVNIPKFLAALPDGMTFVPFEADAGTPMKGYITGDFLNEDERFEKQINRYGSTTEDVCKTIGFQFEGYDVDGITAIFAMVPNNGKPTDDDEHTALICVYYRLDIDFDEIDEAYEDIKAKMIGEYGEDYKSFDNSPVPTYTSVALVWYGENGTSITLNRQGSFIYIYHATQDGDTLQLRASASLG